MVLLMAEEEDTHAAGPQQNDTGSTVAEALAAGDDSNREKLRGWLNQTMKIRMTDGRTLVGTFIGTDKDRNVILGNCQEFFPDREEDGRMLGLAMVPGHHIVSIHIDDASAKNG